MKIRKNYFEDIIEEKKTYEIRNGNRSFQIGDHLGLNEITEETLGVDRKTRNLCSLDMWSCRSGSARSQTEGRRQCQCTEGLEGSRSTNDKVEKKERPGRTSVHAAEKNVPEPKDKTWKKTTCPACGRECWDRLLPDWLTDEFY